MEFITISVTPSESDWCMYLRMRETHVGKPYPRSVGRPIAVRLALDPSLPVTEVLFLLHTALAELVPTD